MKAAVLIGLLLFVQLGSTLLIGAFNIKQFSKDKASNSNVLNIITKIVLRYDIVLIQEVLGSCLKGTYMLMDQLNKYGPAYNYDYIVSEPLGSSSYCERYLFIYRKVSVSVVQAIVYPDTECVFSRPPFVVMFSSGKWNFVLIPLHSVPTEAVKEVDALYNVVFETISHWHTKDILLLGDFNAGCTYIAKKNWANIRLYNDKSYHWLIDDTALTNVIRTCPYDRIVASDEMNKHVVPGSAQVYYFHKELRLTLQETQAVSDHYPVEVRLT